MRILHDSSQMLKQAIKEGGAIWTACRVEHEPEKPTQELMNRIGGLGDIAFAATLILTMGFPEILIKVLQGAKTVPGELAFVWGSAPQTMLALLMWVYFNRTVSACKIRSNTILILMAVSLIPAMFTGLYQFELSALPGPESGQMAAISYIASLAIFFALLYLVNIILLAYLKDQTVQERARFYARGTRCLAIGSFVDMAYLANARHETASVVLLYSAFIFGGALFFLALENGLYFYLKARAAKNTGDAHSDVALPSLTRSPAPLDD